VATYTILQLILVFRTLDDRWPLGDIIFGIAFYAIAQVLLFAFSVTICNAIKHYLDGLFFFTLCVLLSVMMVYKYWDSITVRLSLDCPLDPSIYIYIIFFTQREDLEFSVGSKAAVWRSRIRFSRRLLQLLAATTRKTHQASMLALQALWAVLVEHSITAGSQGTVPRPRVVIVKEGMAVHEGPTHQRPTAIEEFGKDI
jgi:hypothetical protein